MILLYSIFFGAGAAAFVYTKMGSRLGYGNAQNVWVVTGVSFLIATIIFYTIFASVRSL